MSVAVVYWSQTGNTEAMANILAEACGTEAISWEDFSADRCAEFDAFAFGCPAMGAEELDPDFEGLWDACKNKLGDKPVVLFGSYDWGTGEWMDTWKEAAVNDGVNVVDTVIANLEPDAEAEAALKDAAGKLA
ncbi:MAG: flavodoxin domain-containing protein [Atopobiaceae bacterium]|nr:flavodoxin domain-containing protein [Atopobiaceae bacterium]